ncbi:tetratricopeptide repeat-containing sensor histidine kinase [Myroides guanonis]|uniref:Signal transduction histidine kinase n=1 Tax=Myroides guanonis TaxID=1150112 RepID=A0A1I3T2K3_9FLAO|nr:ATP-binding protein [Myroides guanonis]SFJ65368.1 Signal transduction histidine kinase [Myroides guanonis]
MIFLRYSILTILTLLFLNSCKKDLKNSHLKINSLNEIQIDSLTIEEQDSVLSQLFENSLDLKNNQESRAYLIELASFLDEYGDDEHYVKILHRLKTFLTEEKDTLKLGKLYNEFGIHYESLSKFDSAYSYFDRAEKQYQLLGDKLKIGKMAISKASILYDFGIYTESESEAIRALEYFQAANTIEFNYECFHLLGLILCELKEFETSLHYYDKTLESLRYIEQNHLFTPKEITEAYAALYNNIAGVYELKESYKEATIEYEKAFNLENIEQVNPLLYAALLNNRATTKMELGNTDNVLEDLTKAQNIRDSLSQPHELNMSYLRISEYYAIEKDTATALNYAYKAYNNAKRIKNLLDQREALQYLIRLDRTKQLKYNQEYVTVSDKIRSKERQTQHKFARIAYETEQIENQVKLLQIRNRNTIGIASLATLLLLGIVGLLRMKYRNRRLQHQNAQQQADEKIYQMILHQQELSERAKNEERQRIALELHDGVVNRIFTTRFNLMQLESPMHDYKNLLIDELQKAEIDIRNVSHRLTEKGEFKNATFKSMVEDLINKQKNSFDTKFTLSLDQAVNWSLFSLNERLQIFRILQELLQNVNKYSKASQCTVWFLKKENDLVIKIIDNGIGFDQNTKSKGIGFSNIQERAKSISANLTITSKIGSGTQITLILKDFHNRES